VLPDPNASAELIEAVEAAAQVATNEYSVATTLRKRLNDTGDNQTGWTITAFEYGLARRMGDARGVTEIFGPQIVTNSGAYPTPIDHVPEEILALWESVVSGVTAPAAASRLHHLLFVRRHDDVGAHGRAAAEAYVEIGAIPSWSDLDRANATHWAVTLCQRMGMKDEATALLPQLVSLADEFADVGGGPGALFHVLEILAYDLRYTTELPRLLKRARGLYAKDPWHLSAISALEDHVFASDPEQRVRGQRERVQAWLDEADKFGPGLHRMAFLGDAARLANKYGLPDLAALATARLQEITLEDLDLKPIGTTVNVPAEAFDEIVAAQLQHATLADVMRALVDQSPPSGNRAQNEAFAANMEKETPFSWLIPTKRVGEDGLPRIGSVSDEDLEDERLARVELPRIGIAGEVVAQVLEQALERFAPDVDTIIESFPWLSHVSGGVRRSIAKGLIHFGAGAYEEAATLVMPKVETLVRALAQKKKVLRYRVQRDATRGPSTRGQYPQLGALFPQIEPWTDPSWRRFFSTFLVSPFGASYRNELLHGFVEDVSRVNAALTILCALRLALIPLASGDDGDVEDSDEDISE
jgi:hypothetical protein